MRVKNKVVIITGAGSGIGRETAILFAKHGAKVVVTDIDEKGGKETVDEIIKVLMPINVPVLFRNNPPPLLPGFMAASVCIAS